MKIISRYIMTLALLLTAVTGAWADIAVGDVFKTGSTIDFGTTSVRYKSVSGNSDNSSLGIAGKVTLCYEGYSNGKHTFYFPLDQITGYMHIVSDNSAEPWGIEVSGGEGTMGNPFTFEVLFTEPPLKVKWNAATKTGTFAMPAFDVVLTPISAKAAAFATTGTEPDVKTLLPEAAEGVIAGTDASLIAEGTGIVAFAGTSNEVTQGTLMYAIGTSATEAPALTAFSATVPTAKDIADDGATLYVWYYIQGADAPDGQEATAENTFNDSEICTTPLKVTVLTNKFDIQFNAANANTIEAGKATVTVGGTDKTGDITEGKLQGVKMGSEVKVKANTGYKFRKVEVKKGSALKTLTVTGVTTKSIYYAEGDTWQQAIERPENEGSGWRVQGNYIFNGGLTLMIGSGYVRPEHTIDATKNYSLQAD